MQSPEKCIGLFMNNGIHGSPKYEIKSWFLLIVCLASCMIVIY